MHLCFLVCSSSNSHACYYATTLSYAFDNITNQAKQSNIAVKIQTEDNIFTTCETSYESYPSPSFYETIHTLQNVCQMCLPVAISFSL